MMKNYILVSTTCLIILCSIFCHQQHQLSKKEPLLKGSFWYKQALNDIIPYWLKYAPDRKNGGFFTTLNQTWQPIGSSDKIPGMVSRHIFSFSIAYLLSGEEQYFKIAHSTVNYLIEHAWDTKYGGWFDSLAENGKPSKTTKNMFNTIYTNTGLAMYYFLTHDTKVLHYINESNKIIEQYLWDKTKGGYFDTLNQDLTIRNPIKNFTAQFATISGYLLYLYLATKNKQYIEQMERIVSTVLPYMTDSESKWIRESFDEEWNYIYKPAPNGTEINVGHNIEVAWVLLRLYDLTQKEEYLKKGLEIAKHITRWGFDSEKGVWFDMIGQNFPSVHKKTTAWWTQAYGNMLQLFLYHISGNKKHLKYFSKGAKFWNFYFLDKKMGGDFLSVYLDGKLHDGTKATGAKTSYHSMEHCFLNYLYLNLWVNKTDVSLHFVILPQKSQVKHYVVPIEDPHIRITKVTVNGKLWKNYDIQEDYIILPPEKLFKVKVNLKDTL